MMPNQKLLAENGGKHRGQQSLCLPMPHRHHIQIADSKDKRLLAEHKKVECLWMPWQEQFRPAWTAIYANSKIWGVRGGYLVLAKVEYHWHDKRICRRWSCIGTPHCGVLPCWDQPCTDQLGQEIRRHRGICGGPWRGRRRCGVRGGQVSG